MIEQISGEDVQDPNSTSIYNMAEIYEIAEVVKRLQDTWPQESWGSFDENSIGIVSPYSDQVSRIRVHLRHRKLFGINVERVLNVQGKLLSAIAYWSKNGNIPFKVNMSKLEFFKSKP